MPPRPYIVFVVGHKNWGKSRTLRALTLGTSAIRWFEIAGVEYFVRRMSNDDRPHSFLEFMQKCNVASRPAVLAALCPNFTESWAKTRPILQGFARKNYRMFFWVQESSFSGARKISRAELSELRKFGRVVVYSRPGEASTRARALRKYLESRHAA